jgi:hypothetical protein
MDLVFTSKADSTSALNEVYGVIAGNINEVSGNNSSLSGTLCISVYYRFEVSIFHFVCQIMMVVVLESSAHSKMVPLTKNL